MITKETIDAALTAHAQWKKRLQDAIATGQSEFKPEVVKTDNACQFGQWLYGLSSEEKKSDDYLKVKALHANFHRIAGEILQMALSGKKDGALEKLEHGGEYGTASGKLVIALQQWQQKI
jgi:methyl-accepting chemotaxis protein